VRRFDQPQKYKPFVSRCVVKGDFGIGSVREVNVKSGLPATTSTERLELLDDNEHILGVKFVGGDHRLRVWFFPITFLFLFSRHCCSLSPIHWPV
jgi:abscisic acid receptor (PYR/PYL family)